MTQVCVLALAASPSWPFVECKYEHRFDRAAGGSERRVRGDHLPSLSTPLWGLLLPSCG